MIKMNFFAAAAASFIFAGCAANTVNFMDRIDETAILRAYKAIPVGVLTWKLDEKCSEVKFIKYAMENGLADNVVNIVMEETCNGDRNYSQCKCSYAGFGEKFVEIKASENKPLSNVQTPSAVSEYHPPLNENSVSSQPVDAPEDEALQADTLVSDSSATTEDVERGQDALKKQQQSMKRRIDAAKAKILEKVPEEQENLGSFGNDGDYKRN